MQPLLAGSGGNPVLLQHRFIGKQREQALPREGCPLVLESPPDLFPALVVDVETDREEAHQYLAAYPTSRKNKKHGKARLARPYRSDSEALPVD